MHLTPTVKIERVASDGAGETTYEGRSLRIFGMLPGERGIVEIRKRKGIFIGKLKELLDASEDRVQPIDSHFLSSSPWQCMTYPLQAALKESMLSGRYGYYPDTPKTEFVSAQTLAGYRTKMEFSVMDDSGELSLAFHERGGGRVLLPAKTGSILASSAMNSAAERLIRLFDSLGYSEKDIKSIVVRESKTSKKIIGVVYLLREQTNGPDITVLPPGVSGLVVVYSDPRSPASVTTKLLHQAGEGELSELIRGREFAYPWDAFFQNNLPMFERALDDIESALSPGVPLLDLYAGAGTIGISMTSAVPKIHCVEIVESAVGMILKNAERNHVKNVTAELLPAERIPEALLASYRNVVVDPPRAGLHPKLISALLRALPDRLIYLSCNPETQARDYAQLSAGYRIDRIVGYDFYPQTPHLESLLVLSRR